MTTEAEKIKEGCGKKITIKEMPSKEYGKMWNCGEDWGFGGQEMPREYCEVCRAKLSQYKSDLQQELEKWEEVNKVIPEIKSRAKAYCGTMTNGTVLPTPRDWLKKKINERINLIKKELKEIK